MTQIEPEVVLCKSMCIECGFLRDGMKNTLQPNLFEVIEQRRLFPCHLQLKACTGSENTGVEIYVKSVDEIKICRGYIESMYISKVPPANHIWKKLYKQLEDEGFDDRTMNLDEAIEYHKESIYGK